MVVRDTVAGGVMTKVMPKYRPNLKEGAGKLFRF